MRLKLAGFTALAAVVAATAATAGAATTAQTLREFEGTVVSKNREARSFRLRDEGRTVRIFVTRNTRYERLSGFGAIKVGARNIESTVHRRNGRWIAREVERSGRDDRRGGGRDDRGGDDNPGGADDLGIDDH
jgi:lipopolysaccharide export LptBFGC system permease protein LptF